MQLKLGDKKKKKAAASPETPADDSSGKAPGWLKMGGEAEETMAAQAASAGSFQAINDKRAKLCPEFWMKANEEGRITFLSGELSDDPDEVGKLVYVAVNLHSMRHPKFANRWDNYVCLAEEEGGCPFCEADDKPSWVAAFPIIDHRVIERKDNKKEQHVLRMYLAKSHGLKLLHLKANKLGGIAFHTFDVNRTGSKALRTGDVIEHVAEVSKVALAKKFPQMQLDFPAEWYMENLPFFSREEVDQMGFTKSAESAGGDKSSGGGFALPAESVGPIGADDAQDDGLPF